MGDCLKYITNLVRINLSGIIINLDNKIRDGFEKFANCLKYVKQLQYLSLECISLLFKTTRFLKKVLKH